MSSLSAIPSLATAKKAGMMNAVLSTAGMKNATAQTAAGAQASYTGASLATGNAEKAAGSQAQAYQSQGVNANAATRALDKNELTSTNLNRILGEDSPLLQRARGIAKDQANARGMMNSTMGVQAGTTAMIDTATPIAQSDASAHTNYLDRNLANKQQTAIFNAGQEQQNNQFNADQKGTTARFNANLEQQNNQFNTGETNKMTMFNVGNENDINKFNAGLQTDVSKYNAGLTQDNNQFNAREANQISQFNANAYNQNQQFNADAANRNSQFNANAFNNNEQFNTQQANQISVANASEQNAILRAMLDQENRIELANIEAKYKTTMQTQSSAATLYQQTMKDITDILVNPDITPESKQSFIDQKYAALDDGLAFVSDVSGLDLDLNFNRPQSSISTTAAPMPSVSDDHFANVRALSSYAGITSENDRGVLINAPAHFTSGLITTINQGNVVNARNILNTWNNHLAATGQPTLSEDGINKIMGVV